MWPDPRLSEAGRQMLRVEEIREQVNAEGIGAWLDL